MRRTQKMGESVSQCCINNLFRPNSSWSVVKIGHIVMTDGAPRQGCKLSGIATGKPHTLGVWIKNQIIMPLSSGVHQNPMPLNVLSFNNETENSFFTSRDQIEHFQMVISTHPNEESEPRRLRSKLDRAWQMNNVGHDQKPPYIDITIAF